MVAAPIRDETRRLVMGNFYDAVVKWNDFFGGCNLCHKCGGAPRDLCLLLRAHLIANRAALEARQPADEDRAESRAGGVVPEKSALPVKPVHLAVARVTCFVAVARSELPRRPPRAKAMPPSEPGSSTAARSSRGRGPEKGVYG